MSGTIGDNRSFVKRFDPISIMSVSRIVVPTYRGFIGLLLYLFCGSISIYIGDISHDYLRNIFFRMGRRTKIFESDEKFIFLEVFPSPCPISILWFEHCHRIRDSSSSMI